MFIQICMFFPNSIENYWKLSYLGWIFHLIRNDGAYWIVSLYFPIKRFFFYLGICLDILQNRWSPTYDVSAILTSIQSLLDEPNPNRWEACLKKIGPVYVNTCPTDRILSRLLIILLVYFLVPPIRWLPNYIKRIDVNMKNAWQP